MRFYLTLFALMAALGISWIPAHAAPPAMDVQHFQPQADRTGWFTTQSAQTLELWQPAFGLWLSYANKPLIRMESDTIDDVIVRDLLTLDLQAALGFGPVDLAIDMPIHLVVAGDGLAAWGTNVSGAAAGDLRVIPKVRFVDPDKKGFGLGLALPLTLPSGNQVKYAGLHTVSIAPTLLLTGHVGKVRIGGNLGYRITDNSEFSDLVAGNAFLFRAALGIQAHEVVEIGAELFGDVHSQVRNNPVEWLAGVTLHPIPSLGFSVAGGTGIGPGFSAPAGRVIFGVGFAPAAGKDTDGDGIGDAKDACPEDPEDWDGFEDADGCPDNDNDGDGFDDIEDECPDEPETVNRFEDGDGCPDEVGDQDGDGIIDPDDKCPQDAEDMDGFEDGDGCPDPDNDGDKILDVDDKCPDQAEVINNVEDEDGCPDEGTVTVEGGEIRILEKVYFDTGKATIKTKSHTLLKDVAALLVKYPNIKRIEVQGHTDAVGSDELNQRLSQSRAESVRTFLVNQGVGKARLVAKGYGESKPAVPGSSDEANAQNRRVQFVILEQE